ncbi:hypothetical protein NM688_g4990 [Phlebia brevispora]|uniref:Uncharacterized protein n=1 Tax=Phlebia brevispora TaxID=194682 RepID=A0ACC1T1D7_9APHY|nr:hypothetical protein NM688_g4990 [Phlebia brevispora]
MERTPENETSSSSANLNSAPSHKSKSEAEADQLMALLESVQPEIKLSSQARSLADKNLHVLPAPSSAIVVPVAAPTSPDPFDGHMLISPHESYETMLRRLGTGVKANDARGERLVPDEDHPRRKQRNLVVHVPTLEEQKADEEAWQSMYGDTDGNTTIRTPVRSAVNGWHEEASITMPLEREMVQCDLSVTDDGLYPVRLVPYSGR